jgi:hypothetical protein
MVDKRQDARVDDDLGIAINLMSETGPISQRTNAVFHLTKDISKSGIRFENDRPLPLDALLKVHVALKLPLMTITHFGRVRWINKMNDERSYAVGVQFTESPPDDMQIWRDYVDQRVQGVVA